MPSKTIDHAITARSLTSAATDPTHAGVLSFMRRTYSKSLKGAEAVVWGIPFDAAVSNRPGARFGPQAIRRASAIFDNDPQYPFERDLFEKISLSSIMATACSTMAITPRHPPPSSVKQQKS